MCCVPGFMVPDSARANPFDANGKKKPGRKSQKRVFARSRESRIAFDRYFEPRGDVETSALGLKVRDITETSVRLIPTVCCRRTGLSTGSSESDALGEQVNATFQQRYYSHRPNGRGPI